MPVQLFKSPSFSPPKQRAFQIWQVMPPPRLHLSAPLLVRISSHVHASSRRHSVRSCWFCSTVQMSLGAHRGHAAFLQGKISGATSTKGPLVQARAVFGGVAPAPPMLRSRGPTRPGNPNNFLLGNQLTRPRLLRSDLPSRPADPAPRHFPRSTGAGRSEHTTTAPFWGKGHGEAAAGQHRAGVRSRLSQRSSFRS